MRSIQKGVLSSLRPTPLHVVTGNQRRYFLSNTILFLFALFAHLIPETLHGNKKIERLVISFFFFFFFQTRPAFARPGRLFLT